MLQETPLAPASAKRYWPGPRSTVANPFAAKSLPVEIDSQVALSGPRLCNLQVPAEMMAAAL